MHCCAPFVQGSIKCGHGCESAYFFWQPPHPPSTPSSRAGAISAWLPLFFSRSRCLFAFCDRCNRQEGKKMSEVPPIIWLLIVHDVRQCQIDVVFLVLFWFGGRRSAAGIQNEFGVLQRLVAWHMGSAEQRVLLQCLVRLENFLSVVRFFWKMWLPADCLKLAQSSLRWSEKPRFHALRCTAAGSNWYFGRVFHFFILYAPRYHLQWDGAGLFLWTTLRKRIVSIFRIGATHAAVPARFVLLFLCHCSRWASRGKERMSRFRRPWRGRKCLCCCPPNIATKSQGPVYLANRFCAQGIDVNAPYCKSRFCLLFRARDVYSHSFLSAGRTRKNNMWGAPDNLATHTCSRKVYHYWCCFCEWFFPARMSQIVKF